MAHLFICHDCDLLNKTDHIPDDADIKCRRCGATLFKSLPQMKEKALALCISGLIFFLISNFFPFLGFQIGERVKETIFLTGVIELCKQHLYLLSVIVFFTIFVFPLFVLSGITFVLVSLRYNIHLGYTGSVLKYIQIIKPWAMMEILLLGALVSIIKLSDMATIIPGIGFYSFIVLVFINTYAVSIFNPQAIWLEMERTNEI